MFEFSGRYLQFGFKEMIQTLQNYHLGDQTMYFLIELAEHFSEAFQQYSKQNMHSLTTICGDLSHFLD